MMGLSNIFSKQNAKQGIRKVRERERERERERRSTHIFFWFTP